MELENVAISWQCLKASQLFAFFQIDIMRKHRIRSVLLRYPLSESELDRASERLRVKIVEVGHSVTGFGHQLSDVFEHSCGLRHSQNHMWTRRRRLRPNESLGGIFCPERSDHQPQALSGATPPRKRPGDVFHGSAVEKKDIRSLENAMFSKRGLNDRPTRRQSRIQSL
jgi:hypothetical protein